MTTRAQPRGSSNPHALVAIRHLVKCRVFFVVFNKTMIVRHISPFSGSRHPIPKQRRKKEQRSRGLSTTSSSCIPGRRTQDTARLAKRVSHPHRHTPPSLICPRSRSTRKRIRANGCGPVVGPFLARASLLLHIPYPDALEKMVKGGTATQELLSPQWRSPARKPRVRHPVQDQMFRAILGSSGSSSHKGIRN